MEPHAVRLWYNQSIDQSTGGEGRWRKEWLRLLSLSLPPSHLPFLCYVICLSVSLLFYTCFSLHLYEKMHKILTEQSELCLYVLQWPQVHYHYHITGAQITPDMRFMCISPQDPESWWDAAEQSFTPRDNNLSAGLTAGQGLFIKCINFHLSCHYTPLWLSTYSLVILTNVSNETRVIRFCLSLYLSLCVALKRISELIGRNKPQKQGSGPL